MSQKDYDFMQFDNYIKFYKEKAELEFVKLYQELQLGSPIFKD
jgi:hypothetical protein